MTGVMTPRGPSPHREIGMTYRMAPASRVTWNASRGAYSQRRLMLWAADTAGATVEGRRFMPPAGSGGGTQPGRERPHLRRCVPDPSARQGVAHVPAAESRSSAHSARGRLVLCTRDSRPTITPPIVAQDASLSGGLRRHVPV
jgi:hypothetical protein